jgi:hypothetical protein
MTTTELQTNDPNAFAAPVGLEDMERVCVCCGKTKPGSAFRTLACTQCKNCRNRAQGKIKRMHRLKEALAQTASKQILSASRGDNIDAPRISQVCARMVDLFGGVDGFCKQWHEHIAIAMDERPGGRNALDQLRTIAKLIKDSTASVDSANAVLAMTDEELQAEIDKSVARITTMQQLTVTSEEYDDPDLDEDEDEDNPAEENGNGSDD